MNPTVIIDRKALLLSVILIFFLVLLAGGMSAYIAADNGLQNAFAMVRTAYLINEVYPYEFDWDQVVLEARKNMFKQLDRFSGFMETENFDWMDQELSGSYGGIGVSVVKHEDGLLIMSVRENGPAADKSLLTGDIMLMADSVILTGVDYDMAANLLRGE